MLTTIWELLEGAPNTDNERDLCYYLFGNYTTRNRVFWAVDGTIRKDCGIKKFDLKNKPVDLEKVENFVVGEKKQRLKLIEALDVLFKRDILTDKEKHVISLLFDLSTIEELREDGDHREWSVSEIARAMNIREAEVAQIKNKALKKLAPHLKGLL